MEKKNKTTEEKDENKSISKPDPETLHKTDPQDNMQGPISSLVQSVKEEVEENGEKDKKEEEE